MSGKCGGGSADSACGASGGRPLTPNRAPFLFGKPAPDTGVLIGVEREIKAFLGHGAFGANTLRMVDGHQSMTSGSDRKEQVGVGVTTECVITPLVDIGGQCKA